MFQQSEEHGLIPVTFNNYRTFRQPYSAPYLPWNEADEINCLVLEKRVFKESTQLLHSFRVLLPDLPLDHGGHINLPSKVTDKVTAISYDLHDHFHCLRGSNRNAQLQLACLLICLNNNLPIPQIGMSGAEYCMKILLSCFSNSPMSAEELRKVANIQTNASCHRNETIVLMCHALLKSSS